MSSSQNFPRGLVLSPNTKTLPRTFLDSFTKKALFVDLLNSFFLLKMVVATFPVFGGRKDIYMKKCNWKTFIFFVTVPFAHSNTEVSLNPKKKVCDYFLCCQWNANTILAHNTFPFINSL